MACRRRGGSGGNAPQRRQHSVTLGGRRGTQWGSAAVREHGEGEGGRNLGKKGLEGVLTGKGRTAALWCGFIEDRVALVLEGGGGRHR
jgi:hypothetical protein